ncbi:helix-turn-helix transcriptional regulator [[Clostridium] innocuum]
MSMMYLQKNFNYLKFRGDLSFRKIAKETGINTNTLQILSKKNDENMRIEVVLKLADFFQVSLDEFVKKDLTTNF